jgi:hypothetical protein
MINGMPVLDPLTIMNLTFQLTRAAFGLQLPNTREVQFELKELVPFAFDPEDGDHRLQAIRNLVALLRAFRECLPSDIVVDGEPFDHQLRMPEGTNTVIIKVRHWRNG